MLLEFVHPYIYCNNKLLQDESRNCLYFGFISAFPSCVLQRNYLKDLLQKMEIDSKYYILWRSIFPILPRVCISRLLFDEELTLLFHDIIRTIQFCDPGFPKDIVQSFYSILLQFVVECLCLFKSISLKNKLNYVSPVDDNIPAESVKYDPSAMLVVFFKKVINIGLDQFLPMLLSCSRILSSDWITDVITVEEIKQIISYVLVFCSFKFRIAR